MTPLPLLLFFLGGMVFGTLLALAAVFIAIWYFHPLGQGTRLITHLNAKHEKAEIFPAKTDFQRNLEEQTKENDDKGLDTELY